MVPAGLVPPLFCCFLWNRKWLLFGFYIFPPENYNAQKGYMKKTQPNEEMANLWSSGWAGGTLFLSNLLPLSLPSRSGWRVIPVCEWEIRRCWDEEAHLYTRRALQCGSRKPGGWGQAGHPADVGHPIEVGNYAQNCSCIPSHVVSVMVP
ncbi:hypothetical protein NPIL_202971 [Nephila pilipes]|uniref:Uncharacterized protein n=1 Tax=Nephila pilipes TaxID=299642 RepID=A0A8X6IWI6_NEPPI|nr:hypothetical protein NPIL_202971 [Nephila pilipes]